MPVSRQKEERMWKLADKMARSGECHDWLDIEWALRDLGYRRARQLLDNEQTRDRLNRMCAKAQSERTNA